MREDQLSGLGRFLSRHLAADPNSGPAVVEPLAGGRSNPTYFLRWGGHDLVLRTRPAGAPPGAHDVGREYRVLTALHPTPVPVPAPIAHCTDESIIGVEFYVMRRVEGRVVTTAAGAPDLVEPDRARLLGHAMIERLAELHRVDPAAVGLADLGRGNGYVRRQVERWANQWATQGTRSIPEYDELGRRLRRALELGAVDPVPIRPTVVHGDFNLGNLLIADAGSFGAHDVVRAVLDWEFATLGHPLMDLGVLLSYNGPYGHLLLDSEPLVSSRPPFPSPDELCELYARSSDYDLGRFDFFYVLGFYRTLIINEDVRRRHLAGELTGPNLENIGRGAQELGAHLLDVADRSAVPGLDGRVRTQHGKGTA
jgi:aminoglycoside phosphotransferase (APT) family kinase protein